MRSNYQLNSNVCHCFLGVIQSDDDTNDVAHPGKVHCNNVQQRSTPEPSSERWRRLV